MKTKDILRQLLEEQKVTNSLLLGILEHLIDIDEDVPMSDEAKAYFEKFGITVTEDAVPADPYFDEPVPTTAVIATDTDAPPYYDDFDGK